MKKAKYAYVSAMVPQSQADHLMRDFKRDYPDAKAMRTDVDFRDRSEEAGKIASEIPAKHSAGLDKWISERHPDLVDGDEENAVGPDFS